MIINQGNLQTLFVGFNTAFRGGVGQAASQYNRVATRVPSTTAKEEYGWLGKIPGIREWIGERAVQALMQHDYAIKNKKWESTVEVDRDHIEDDNLGMYGPLFGEMGLSTAAHPDQLVFALLQAGFSTPCYDKQYYFDTDHPVLDENGQLVSVANTDGGSGQPWFLVDDKRILKPIIYQVRRDFSMVRKDRPEDDNVFHRDVYLYGVDGRSNVGFGFWQYAWGSKQTLNAANYALARQSLMGMKGDYGRKLGIMPRTLLVPPALESAGRKLLINQLGADGETNEWQGTAELLVVPWLA